MATQFSVCYVTHMRMLSTVSLIVAIASRLVAQAPSDSLCIFSGPERSTLAWESAAHTYSGGVAGQIILLRDRRPVPFASVTLEPGAWRAVSDSAGHFQLTGPPNGRYLLRIRAIGRPTVADSITLGADGLTVLAVLAQPPGDIGVSCSNRSRRSPNGGSN